MVKMYSFPNRVYLRENIKNKNKNKKIVFGSKKYDFLKLERSKKGLIIPNFQKSISKNIAIKIDIKDLPISDYKR
jgi:hypothetical protein